MTRFLLYILPILPTLIYLAYYVYKGRRRSADEILVGIKQGNWVRVVIVSIFLSISVILFLALETSEYKGDKYIPAKYENGVLVPNHIEN